MNNEINDLTQKNKSLLRLMGEYESLVAQKDTNIAQQMVIIQNDQVIIGDLKMDKINLSNDLEKQTKKTKFWKSVAYGSLAAIPASIVFGALMMKNRQMILN